MARRELKLINVMTRIEPSLHTLLLDILIEEDDSASTFMRALLLKELKRRGRLDSELEARLMGAAS